MSDFNVVLAGDSMLVVEFEERIDLAINARAISLARSLQGSPVGGVRDVVPTYRSVAVFFDPLRTDYDALLDRLTRDAARPIEETAEHRGPIRIPVCYGADFGPDLPGVARFARMTEDEVVALHAAGTYHVFMLGFVPGFAYLGSVDPRIAAPRHTTPRVRVPPGSVGIAGAQTGIYPAETPGGWQLIGRTPLKPFDIGRPDPFLMKPGDSVTFLPIDRAEYERLR